MLPFYENRVRDFWYRNDKNQTVRLGCAPHLHRHIEIAYLIEGHTDGYADSAVCHMESGDLFISFPNQIHRFVSYGPEKYMLFIINPEMVPEFGHILNGSLPNVNCLKAADQPPEIYQILRMLAKSAMGPEQNRYYICKGYLLAFFGELFKYLPLNKFNTSDTQVIRTIIDYCIQNYTSPLSLDKMSADLHISKYYISHLFSSKLNVRFNDYINTLRVTTACRYLCQTEMSITEISENVGFSTLRTFNRVFIRNTNQTPSEYRKNKLLETYTASIPI